MAGPVLALLVAVVSGCAGARPLTRVEQCRLAHGPRAVVVVGPRLQTSVVSVPGGDYGLCDRLARVEAENAALRARVARLERETATHASAPTLEVPPSPY